METASAFEDTFMRSLSSPLISLLGLWMAAFPAAPPSGWPAGRNIDTAIGKPVIGLDGQRIGDVNRIKADAYGRITEIEVTTGGPVGLDADVITINPSLIEASLDGASIRLALQAPDTARISS